MCGSVWLVSARTPPFLTGRTEHPSPSLTGLHHNRSSPLRIPTVSPTLERCVCVCWCNTLYSSLVCTFFVCTAKSITFVLFEVLQKCTLSVFPQFHSWRIEDCTQMLPFMCQRKGEVNESAAQVGCSSKDVSILTTSSILHFLLNVWWDTSTPPHQQLHFIC